MILNHLTIVSYPLLALFKEHSRQALFSYAWTTGGFLVGDPDLLDKLQEIMKTFTKIRLMANPIDADHQELIAVLTRAMTTPRTAQLDEDLEPSIRQAVEEVVRKSQVIFNREWGRMKAGE